jgi:hypothetical protein
LDNNPNIQVYQKEGYGTYFYEDGSIYEGNWHVDKKEG